MDRQWWEAHEAEVSRTFRGQRFSTNNLPEKFRSTYLAPPFDGYGNSGAGCIALALAGDADRVVMVGFDCQHTGGQAHWHGNHPRGLTNAAQIPKWPALFKRLREANPDAIIYNASRVSALDVFPRIPLEDALL